MSGGGARAAYQVGVVRYIASKYPELATPILTGVSAGAINAAAIASSGDAFNHAVDGLTRLWQRIRTEDVIDVNPAALSSNVVKWGMRFIGGGTGVNATRGMMDTEPLRRLLLKELCTGKSSTDALPGVAARLASGKMNAFAVTTTNYSTGQSITWVEGKGASGWERPFRVGVTSSISVEHIMASAALPFVFPAVQLGNTWHGDGGIRQLAPLSPALHLGADRILAIATRRARTLEYVVPTEPQQYPPLALIGGVLLNSVFLDLVDYDAMNLARVNDLIARVPPEDRGGLRSVGLLVIRPSQDLGRLAREYERDLPGPFRFLTRGWGTRELASPDSLSMLLFEGRYATRLMDLGETDARNRADDIARFIEAGT